jgi:hypothetical protein
MNLLRHYRLPTLQHHGSKWVYHFPEQRQGTIRCPRGDGWTAHTVSLAGTGQIHNAPTCPISGDKDVTSPEWNRRAVPSTTRVYTAPKRFSQSQATRCYELKQLCLLQNTAGHPATNMWTHAPSHQNTATLSERLTQQHSRTH